MNLRQIAKGLTPPAIVFLAKKFLGIQHHLPPVETELEIRPGIRLRLHPESVGPMRMFVDRNAEMIQEFDNFLRLSQDCRRLLDIGALHGAFSLAFTTGSPGRSALAIDASPYAFARLLYNVRANPQCHIITEECAVSDSAGHLKMGVEWEHAVASSNSPLFISVEKFAGDEICARHRFKPDAIKIDIEGHELAALRGLANTLKVDRPMVFLEVHPSRVVRSGGSMPELHAIIRSFSYQIHSLEGAAISEPDFCNRAEDFRATLSPA